MKIGLQDIVYIVIYELNIIGMLLEFRYIIMVDGQVAIVHLNVYEKPLKKILIQNIHQIVLLIFSRIKSRKLEFKTESSMVKKMVRVKKFQSC